MSTQEMPLNTVVPETLEDSSLDTAQYDQTLFAEDVLFTNMDSRAEDPVPQQPQSKKKLRLLVVLGFFAAALFATSLYLQFRRSETQGRLITEEATQQQQAQGIPALERQLSLLRNDIETADPLESPLAFPPLDFRLNLQDATAIQLQAR